MEFGVAAFSAAAAVVIPKLFVMMEKKLKKKPEIGADLRCIKEDLEVIRATIGLHGPNREHVSRHVGCLCQVFITQLRRLEYDIEDCIDRFDAKKMALKDFSKQIAILKQLSTNMSDRVQKFKFPEDCRNSQGQGADDPAELQNLGDNNLYCLLYLCLFPHDYDVRTKPLVRRWLAEGLVQGEQHAVQNLDILTNSSIFNSIQRSNNGKVKRCQPTAKTLENIAQLSLAENFILVCDGTAQLQGEEARRLSVHPSANVHLNLPRDLSRIRTLAVFSAGSTDPASYEALLNFTKYGEVLRVLDLKECAHLSDDHIQAICSNQVLMKYLSINLSSIDEITRSIGKLNQLETLDLSGSRTVTVFKEVLLLPKLKHLLGMFQLSKRDTFNPGWRLKKFLRDKSVLEVMAGFVTGGSPGFPQLMSRMRRLRKVKIWFESDPSQKNLDAISRAITKFIRDGTNEPDLNRSLSMDMQKCSGEFLNTIYPVKGRLDSLKLRGKLSQFPQFVAQLRAIQELCLWSTGLSWGVIRDGLNDVMRLKYLKLVEDNLGPLDILSEADHLKAIERICVVCKQSLEIAITAAPVPNLVSLHIICQYLHFIPRTNGIDITDMASLEEVALHPRVDGAIRAGLQQAADGHSNMHPPKLVFLEYPQ